LDVYIQYLESSIHHLLCLKGAEFNSIRRFCGGVDYAGAPPQSLFGG